MSFSVDDLVSSLTSSHIGQEANDLAALHAQLARSLFNQPFHSTSTGQDIPRGQNYVQPCNTPTRTPTSCFDWAPTTEANKTAWRECDEMEDERMVEDLLIPSSPMLVNPTNSPFPSSHNSMMSPTTAQMNQASPGPCAAESPTSLFASTDPFYVAQVIALQNGNSSPPSFFSQSGRPASHSPFLQQQHPQLQMQQKREHYNSIHDNRSLFISTPS